MRAWVTALLVFAFVTAVLLTATDKDPDFSTDLCAYRTGVRVQVVVSRYAEDLSWLRLLPYKDVVVYDKNDTARPSSGNPPPYAKVVHLPNVGRCDHTYLHHILRNWDQLADVTLFVPASCPSSPWKWNKLSWVVAHVSRTGDSAFPVDKVTRRPVHEALASFKMDDYMASARANASVNPEQRLLPCEHRPFREFYRHAFPDLPPVHELCYKGVFAVSRAHIRQTPKKTYARLVGYLDHHSNPEAGHFMERAWLAAFHPIPDECLLTSNWEYAQDDLWIVQWSAAALLALLALALLQKFSQTIRR